MKLLMSAAFVFIFSTAIYSQEVTLKTEKKEYKIDENIVLVFEVKATVDSETTLNGTNFTLIDGPKKRLATTTKDGFTSTTFTSTYTIKADSPGLVEIVSPKFHFNNQDKSAGNFVFKVSDAKLTEKEMDEINFDKFRENAAKAKDAVRFVVSDNFGFIEKFT